MPMSSALKLAMISLLVGTVVLALKALAWWLTGSVALLSDALESIVNLAAALAALVAIRVAERPADVNHPFGHHKAEYMSAVLEGALIIAAAFFIIFEAVERGFAPRPIDAPVLGLVLAGAATVLNAGWARVLIRRGKAMGSPALVHDGHHLWADVVTTIGVSIGLVLTVLTGWHILDPLFAIAVALHILWIGWGVFKQSVSGLMDEAVPEDTLALIRATIAAESDGAIEAHDLRTRNAGRAIFIEFHLVVPGTMQVTDAHKICDRLEDKLQKAVPQSQITIHIEPDDKVKPAPDTITAPRA